MARVIVGFTTTFNIYEERNERFLREIPQETLEYAKEHHIGIETLEFNRVNGKLFAYLKDDSMIGGLFLRNGWYWEYWMDKYLRYHYIPNTNMIDIGAHIGTSSLLMSDIITKNYTVHAFEPIFYDLCKINIINNNCSSIMLYPFALGDSTGKVQFSFSKDEPLNFGTARITEEQQKDKKSFDINRITEEQQKEIKSFDINRITESSQKDKKSFDINRITETLQETKSIEVKRLDDFNTGKVSIIKIDVEGYELQVLRGGMSTIRKNRPTILIEIHSESYTKYIRSNEFTELFQIGYILIKIYEGYDDFILIPRNVINS